MAFEPKRVMNGLHLRQFLRAIVVGVLMAGQLLLVAHACASGSGELVGHSAVVTPGVAVVPFETPRPTMDGARYLPQRADGDCPDLALRAVLASEPGIVPYGSRMVPRSGSSTDLPKPVVAGRVRVSWLGIADRGAIDPSWLGNPPAINSPPQTILHCCWRI